MSVYIPNERHLFQWAFIFPMSVTSPNERRHSQWASAFPMSVNSPTTHFYKGARKKKPNRVIRPEDIGLSGKGRRSSSIDHSAMSRVRSPNSLASSMHSRKSVSRSGAVEVLDHDPVEEEGGSYGHQFADAEDIETFETRSGAVEVLDDPEEGYREQGVPRHSYRIPLREGYDSGGEGYGEGEEDWRDGGGSERSGRCVRWSFLYSHGVFVWRCLISYYSYK